MTSGPQELRSPLIDHREHRLSRDADGGFRLDATGGGAIVARPDAGGWSVALPDRGERWRLARNAPETGGFRLCQADGRTEEGRTTPLGGVGSGADLYYLLLRDGRLFRIGPRGARQAGLELSGWETSGAYLIARPGDGDWSLIPTPACGGLPDTRALSILFAAEVLESEAPLGPTSGGVDGPR